VSQKEFLAKELFLFYAEIGPGPVVYYSSMLPLTRNEESASLSMSIQKVS